MRYSPESAARILTEVRKIMDGNGVDDYKIAHLWHTLVYLRGTMLSQMLKNTIGNKVYAGPFKGMALTDSALSGASGPILTGLYEHELHATFERVIACGYKTVLNIGSSFGYYAVGLALRMPDAVIEAFDINAKARQRCTDMAALNAMQDRITVKGEFRGEDFAGYDPDTTLAIVDIEGAESILLDPVLYPNLQKMDIIVELHDVLDPALSSTIMARFATTHDIDFIMNRPAMFDFDPLIGAKGYVGAFDPTVIAWENRDGATPWGVMKAKRS